MVVGTMIEIFFRYGFSIEISNIWRLLGFRGGNVFYPGSALRNQSMAFSKQPIIEDQLSQRF